ncbi:hypothetical protein, partial [Lacimicrobium alkaliphilum]|uniref:hypothetical protein n=1 Tax=Lacimicrobium alkaliphilum TaxID=1526571 RepID=UPI001C557979
MAGKFGRLGKEQLEWVEIFGINVSDPLVFSCFWSTWRGHSWRFLTGLVLANDLITQGGIPL